MLSARDALVDKAHTSIMPNAAFDPLIKGIFYTLLMQTYTGVGDTVMIRRDQIELVKQWYAPSRVTVALATIMNLGIVVTESGDGV